MKHSIPLIVSLLVACGGGKPSSSTIVCGAGTTQQGNTCVADKTEAMVTLESAPEAEVDAAKVADFAARVCECRDTTCAIDVSRQLSDWNRTREVAPTPALMQATRVFLACVAKISSSSLEDSEKPVASRPAPPPVESPPDPELASIAEFKNEFVAVSKLLEKLRAKDPTLADQPLRLFSAVKDNYASGLQDRHSREQLMRILAKVRAATQKRLDSL